MRILLLVFVLLTTAEVNAESDKKDWRKSGSADEKLDNVVQVIPSAADIMFHDGGAVSQSVLGRQTG